MKNKIRERFRPYDYTTPSEFCEKVIVAVSEIIKKYFLEDEIVTSLNRERIAQRAYINSRHSCYFKRQSDFEDIDSFINSDTDNLIFTGDSGIGKSALLANWIKINEDNHDINTPQYNVFFNLILQRFENDYSANQELVRHALTLISVSEHGLSEDEIISILKCRPIDWHLFFCAFYNNFLISNGLISFSHKYIIEAINERYKIKYLQSYVDDEAKVILCRHEIIDYCSTNDSYRSLKEKAYQFYKLNEWENLFKILSSIKGFVVFYNNNRDTLERYWLSLSINGYSTEVYISQLEGINGDARIEILTILSKFAIYNNTNRTVADFCTQELVSNSNNLSELDYMNALIIRGDCVRMFNGDLKLAKFLYKRALEIATNHNISALIIQQRLLSTDYELCIDGMNNSA